MTLGTAYVLGTHDQEIARLGIQHRVWRPYMLDAWPEHKSHAVMITPLVLEIIAEKE